ncbi:tryptophan--tRNA ligase [Buchnera aphidicola]|uniref:tryptophan--tRNA ligase n=1 Tax=Buchnera aphidicola TaxID=9 RepID=UPI0039677C30
MNDINKVLFSAIQPSGQLTIGNYIGVMRQWIKMQDTHTCLYCIADLHAITTRRSPKELRRDVLDTIALYLACGFDPYKSIIFLQSQVHQHSQLCWLLTCYTYYGELSRMTQFKDKYFQGNKNVNSGLFNYPILMASDILLYKTDIVPIGKDQSQHLELTRNIARRFNSYYGNIFTVPVRYMVKHGSNILSLLNPCKKMSKSDSNKNNVIFLLDSINSVSKKIQSAVTDSNNPHSIHYDMTNKKGISNLLNVLSGLTDKTISDLEIEYSGKSYRQFKSDIIEIISDILIRLQSSYFYYRQNEEYLENILYYGSSRACLRADKLLNKVKKAIGLI